MSEHRISNVWAQSRAVAPRTVKGLRVAGSGGCWLPPKGALRSMLGVLGWLFRRRVGNWEVW